MKILIIGWFGAGNMGDEAILISELLFMKEKLKDVEFYIISFNPERTGRLVADIPEVKKILRMGAKKDVIKSDFLGIIKAFRNVHAVIIGGGGIFQDIYNHYPIPFFTALAFFAKVNRKFTAFYCVGIGPVNSYIGKKLCRVAANSVDFISVRDPESSDLLIELGVLKEIQISADPVFLLKPFKNLNSSEILKRYKINDKDRIVGVCVQDLFDWDDSNRIILAEILDKLKKEKRCNVVFIPLGFYRDSCSKKTDSDKVDVVASKKIMSLMKESCSLINEELNPGELLAIIENMDLIISARLHGVIMGLSMGANVIALTYNEETKIRNLMNRTKLQDSLFDIRNLGKDKLLSRITNLLLGNIDRKHAEKIISSLRSEGERLNELLALSLINNSKTNFSEM